jgi:opacity protein-like surface antigen
MKLISRNQETTEMKLKSLLAATTAFALVAAAPSANAGDLYVSVFGGLNMLADDSGPAFSATDGTSAWDSDADTGFVLGGTVGTSLDRWAEGLRVEMEVSYRRNDLGGSYFTDDDVTEIGVIDGNMSTFAILENDWYEFDIGSKMRPYVGGGVGWGRMHGDMVALTSGGPSSGTSTSDVTESGFAWQLGLGGRYEVSPGVDVGIGYRYFRGPDFHDFFGGNEGSLENENHAVQVELKIDIQ